MLPFVYASKNNGISTEYGHDVSHVALTDFTKNLPDAEDYHGALRVFVNTLYEKQCLDNEVYFLDKTPRYYFIIREIAEIFPDAKFIFLFRNPVHVMASMIQTWSSGNLRHLYNFDRDVTVGSKALSDGYELLKDRSYAVQYEQFVTDPEKYTKEICRYLEIPFDERMLDDFHRQDTQGRYGDEVGVDEYSHISSEPLEKWRYTFCSRYRKRFITRFIEDIDSEVFEVQQYDKKSILNDIAAIEPTCRNFFKDRIDHLYCRLARLMKSEYH